MAFFFFILSPVPYFGKFGCRVLMLDLKGDGIRIWLLYEFFDEILYFNLF